MAARIPLETTSIPGIFRRKGVRKTSYTVVVAIGTDAKGNPIQRRETFDSFAAAKEWRTKTAHELASHAYVEPSKEKVGTYLDRWVDDQRGRVKPVTVLLYRQAFARLTSLHPVRLCDLDAPKIANAVKAMEKAGYAAGTVAKTYSHFRTALADAVRHNLLAINPCDRMRGPKGGHADPVRFDEVELDRFREFVAGDRYEVLWETALETGMRFGELAALRWANVDLDEQAIFVVENITRTEENRRTLGTPKSDTGLRSLGLSDELTALLREHRNEIDDRKRHDPTWNAFDLVFPGELGRYMSPSTMNDILADLCRRASVKVITFHSLRHTSATFQIEAGIPTKTVSERLGHVDPAYTLRTYVHPDRASHRRAADLFGAHLRKRRCDGVEKTGSGEIENPATKPESESE